MFGFGVAPAPASLHREPQARQHGKTRAAYCGPSSP
jgi:hypothetical protein